MEMLGYMGSVFLLTLGHKDQSPTDSEDVVILPDKNAGYTQIYYTITAAAAKLLQSCPTLCDPRDGSLPGSPIPGILQARVLEWGAIALSDTITAGPNNSIRSFSKRICDAQGRLWPAFCHVLQCCWRVCISSAGLLPVQSFLEVLVPKILSEILSIILGSLTSHFESLDYWCIVFIPVIGGKGNLLQYSCLPGGLQSTGSQRVNRTEVT